MEQYRIRVTVNPGAIVEKTIDLENDAAAIAYGQRLAGPGETLEVWRGSQQVFMSEEHQLPT